MLFYLLSPAPSCVGQGRQGSGHAITASACIRTKIVFVWTCVQVLLPAYVFTTLHPVLPAVHTSSCPSKILCTDRCARTTAIQPSIHQSISSTTCLCVYAQYCYQNTVKYMQHARLVAPIVASPLATAHTAGCNFQQFTPQQIQGGSGSDQSKTQAI